MYNIRDEILKLYSAYYPQTLFVRFVLVPSRNKSRISAVTGTMVRTLARSTGI